MKNMFNKIFVCLLFAFAFIVLSSNDVSAKSSTGSTFEIEVGEDKLPLYYSLVNSQYILEDSEIVGVLEDGVISLYSGETYTVNEGKVLNEEDEEIGIIVDNSITMSNGKSYTLSEESVKEKILVSVELKGVSNEAKNYRWEHTFCYKISGKDEICEKDLTGSDQGEGSQSIYSNKSYSFSFWDGHMPYYEEGLVFEYFKFSNKFISLQENDNEVVLLDDIYFSGNEIDYNYQFKVDAGHVENNEKNYVDNYYSNNASDKKVYIKGILYNNLASNLNMNDAPTFTLTNEVCVGENICEENVIESVNTTSGETISLTPYIGNFTFYYSSSLFAYDDSSNIPYEFAKYKSVLTCTSNCNSRIPSSIVLLEETFYFDIEKPVVDTENTIISSVDEYVKSVEIKITVSDSKSGLDSENLYYQLIKPYYDSCSWGSSSNFLYENGVSFTLGLDLSDGPYCMRYYAYDNMGNYVVSNYYIFYFDNNGPSLTINEDTYDENKYYNEITLETSLYDYYSGLKETYYLWSTNDISEENYLSIKENGKIYDNSGTITSLESTNDGSYYLYLLAYDNLGNYKYYKVGKFNIDRTGLSINDIAVEVNGLDNYDNGGSIKVNVSEMSNGETFECGFFNVNNVTVDVLNLVCKNNANIDIPSDLEGKYSLWVYVHDRANNYSLIEVSKDLFIDTKGPEISYSVLKDEDKYHIVNEVTLSVSDLNQIDSNSLKYGWFLANKNNVSVNDLTEKFENGETIGYPKNCYGEYKLYVRAIDSLGNERFISLDKIFKIDTDIIRISLVGEESITIIRGQEYVEKGAMAYKGDVSSGGRVSSISVEGKVNNKKAGVYYVTYSSGEGDLLVSVTRKVIVKTDVPYLLIVGSLFVVGSIVLSFRLFVRKKKTN